MIRDYLASRPARTQVQKEIEVTADYYHDLSTDHIQQAKNIRTDWQAENGDEVHCLQSLPAPVARHYEEVFQRPQIHLALLPAYSFLIQFTFTLIQPYISRDEQDFYIIDNPVRKDRVFGLPYVASSSWKGSLRAALWHQDRKSRDEQVRHLFGNEKETDEPEHFRAGCLSFFPTFFTTKSLEIINAQDRRQRTGKIPVSFESVPKNAEGIFTLLYVPFDRVGEDEQRTREQVREELNIVAEGIQAMFRIYGFGAKTSDGFGLAKEEVAGGMLKLRAAGFEKPEEEKAAPAQLHRLEWPFESCEQLVKRAEEVAKQLTEEK